MNLFSRAALKSRTAASVMSVLCACVAIGAVAPAAEAVHFEVESLPALKLQLEHGQVHALAFHPQPSTGNGHIHVSLNNGGHDTIVYAISEQATLAALARAHSPSVTIAVAKAKASKSAHHTLRYVAAAILVVVIIVIAAVLLIDRRRKLRASGGEEPESSALPSSGEIT